MFKVGLVTHYYDKLQVAIISLSANLAIGETVLFMHKGEPLFKQNVLSIQIDHKEVSAAKVGDIVAIKTQEEVKPDAEVYKVQEN